MIGFLRRTLTGNGKAGNHKITGPSLIGEGNPKPKPRTLAVIHEESNMIYVDIEYCRNGVNEGWLTLDGWHRDNNDIVYRYVMTKDI